MPDANAAIICRPKRGYRWLPFIIVCFLLPRPAITEATEQTDRLVELYRNMAACSETLRQDLHKVETSKQWTLPLTQETISFSGIVDGQCVFSGVYERAGEDKGYRVEYDCRLNAAERQEAMAAAMEIERIAAYGPPDASGWMRINESQDFLDVCRKKYWRDRVTFPDCRKKERGRRVFKMAMTHAKSKEGRKKYSQRKCPGKALSIKTLACDERMHERPGCVQYECEVEYSCYIKYRFDTIIDGRTFTVLTPDGQRETARLIGISADGLGPDSAAFLELLLKQAQHLLHLDVRGRDQEGRLLVYAYNGYNPDFVIKDFVQWRNAGRYDDPKVRDHFYLLNKDNTDEMQTFINATMISAGFARPEASVDLQTADLFHMLLQEAQAHRRGRWN